MGRKKVTQNKSPIKTSGDNGQAKRNENYQRDWLRIFMILLEYKAKYGHVDVPTRTKCKGIHLGNWVVRQRVIKDKLTKEQRSLLNKAGFNWAPYRKDWEYQYKILLKFYEKHGHTIVPMNYEKSPQLARWVNVQRRKYQAGKLSEEKIKRLNHMNFVWNIQEFQWETMYEKLKTYQKKHGDFFVKYSKTNGENRDLGMWKNVQIRAFRAGTLKPNRYEKLKAIGFDLSDKKKYDY